LDVALQVQRDSAGRPRHVERIEGQRGRAAQLEAAAGEDKGEQKREGNRGEFHQTTMLIRRPGTMMVLRMTLPSMYFFTASAAMLSVDFWSADLGTFTLPRVLPPTCTT